MKKVGLIANIIFTFVNLLLGIKEFMKDNPSWALFHFMCGAAAWVAVLYFMNGINKQNK